MNKINQRKGLLFLLLPLFFLIYFQLEKINLIYFENSLDEKSGSLLNFFKLSYVFFDYLSLIILILIIPGIIIGIYFLKKKDENKDIDIRSGKGRDSEVPKEILKWSWGASFLTFIWGLYHRVWLSFLVFVPIINIFWFIFLGIYGNRWAWQNNKWKSVAEFKRQQKKWNIFGIICFIFQIIIISFFLYLFSSDMFKETRNLIEESRQSIRDTQRVSDVRQIKTAFKLYYYSNNEFPNREDVTTTINDVDNVLFGKIYSDEFEILNPIPQAPIPPDGNCSAEDNYYKYSEFNGEIGIMFCLGEKLGDYNKGKNFMAVEVPDN